MCRRTESGSKTADGKEQLRRHATLTGPHVPIRLLVSVRVMVITECFHWRDRRVQITNNNNN